MAFSSNGYQQLGLMDRMGTLSRRGRKALDRSWAKYFGDEIFPAIDERKFAVLYSTSSASPSAPVNVTIAAMILEEILDLNDDEIVESALFDVRFQYALHTTSRNEQPISARTIQRMRKKIADYARDSGKDLLEECMQNLAEKLDQMLDTYFATAHLNTQRVLALAQRRVEENGLRVLQNDRQIVVRGRGMHVVVPREGRQILQVRINGRQTELTVRHGTERLEFEVCSEDPKDEEDC